MRWKNRYCILAASLVSLVANAQPAKERRLGIDLGLAAVGTLNAEFDEIIHKKDSLDNDYLFTVTAGWRIPIRHVERASSFTATLNAGTDYLHGSTVGCWSGPLVRMSYGWRVEGKRTAVFNSFGCVLSYGATDTFRADHRDNLRSSSNSGYGAYQIQKLDRFEAVPYFEQSYRYRWGRRVEGSFYWDFGIAVAFDHLTVSYWKAPQGMKYSTDPYEASVNRFRPYLNLGIRTFWVFHPLKPKS